MIRNYADSSLFIDVGLLRDHVSKLREKKKTATRLYESVKGMRRADDPESVYRYRAILQEIDALIEYFDRMAALLDNVGDDAVELSHKIQKIFEDGADYTRYTISENFLL